MKLNELLVLAAKKHGYSFHISENGAFSVCGHGRKNHHPPVLNPLPVARGEGLAEDAPPS